MFKGHKAIILSLVSVLAVCFIFSAPAYGANGTRELGFSARDSAMAGATTASPEDTSCLIKNPASLIWIGNRVDAMYQSIFPHDVKMHTEGPGLAALGGAPLANAGMRQKSTIKYIPAGDLAVSYQIPKTENHPIAVGVGAFTMAGIESNFPSSRINPAVTGNYDKMADLRSMRIAPGLAVGLTKKLSVGATGNIEIQGFRTNMATSTYAQTRGAGDWDWTAGAGFTLGLLYRFSEMLDLGATYESHTWMGTHKKYKDCIPRLDEPPVISFGLALKLVKNLILTYDTRYINWTDVKIADASPIEGGFGWCDQWVFATGGEYTFKDKKDNDKLKLRLGYNYGKSPVQSHVAFANALFPVVMEHHITTGFSYYIIKDLSLDLTWEHHFMGAQADNGAGDAYSVAGYGTKITAAADIVSVGLGYKF